MTEIASLAPCPSYPGYYAREDGEIIGPSGKVLKEIWKGSGGHPSGPYISVRRRWVMMGDLFLDAMLAAFEEDDNERN